MEITRIPISAYRFSTIGQTAKSDGTESQAAALVGSFGDVLGKALTQVNELQLQADSLSQKLATGEITDAHTVTIAAEKAALALEMTIQIRNKVMEAYQEIMRMQL
jgi:flagellar hook-basal body complex protein FliE